MLQALALLLVAVSFPQTRAIFGLDDNGNISISTFSCLRNLGYEFVVMRVYDKHGHVDFPGIDSVRNAQKAGFARVDGYLFPCVPCATPRKQVRDTVKALHEQHTQIGRLWLDVEIRNWTSDFRVNQLFVKAMIKEGVRLNRSLGVYSSVHNWKNIVGVNWTYPARQNLPLWYAHYDGKPSFDDFKPFGGWRTPVIKQFAGDAQTTCAQIDKDYAPRMPP